MVYAYYIVLFGKVDQASPVLPNVVFPWSANLLGIDMKLEKINAFVYYDLQQYLTYLYMGKGG